jgi:FAD dependent oxidoreductase
MSEVVVVGAGVVGLAVAHELTRAGHHVTVVSADVPGSRQSRGLARIFRLAHADGALTDAAATSLGLWEEWEARAGRTLLDRVGLLLTGDVADREAHLARHGGVERGSGPRHPLAVSLEAWSFELTGAATRAEDTVRFLQEGLELGLTEAEHLRQAHPRILSIAERVFPGLRPVAERVVACEFPLRFRASDPALAHDGWDLIEHEGVLGLTGPALFKFAPLLGQLATRRLDQVPV